MRPSNTILLIIALAAIPAAAYFIFTNAQRGSIACTQEAMLCPDGSYVGRSGPTCSFAECPMLEHRPDWLSTSTPEFAYEYPKSIGTQGYIDAAVWPPTLSLSAGTLSCEQGSGGITRTMKTIGTASYCVEGRDDAAAGSRYTAYTYSVARDAGVISISFTIRRVQCMNYDEPRQGECQRAQAGFDADQLADGIARTARFLIQPPVVPSI